MRIRPLQVCMALLVFGLLAVNVHFLPKIRENNERNVLVEDKTVIPEITTDADGDKEAVEETHDPIEEKKVARALIESCSGWKLNALPQLKAFVLNEAKNYENLEVKFISGVDPKIIFFDADGEKLEEMKIGHLSVPALHELLATKGIHKRKEEFFSTSSSPTQ